MENKYRLRVTLTNETQERTFSDWDEPLEDWLLADDGTPDFGRIYRLMRSEYGRCQSSVYVDTAGGSPRRVGWFFVKRQEYEDTRESYLRGAWVEILRLIEPAKPAVYERLTVDEGVDC